MTKIAATNITWHHGHVGREQRNALLRQSGATIWFTGLSGSGKSTIAYTVEHALVERGHLSFVLDGDNIRHGLNKNLGFSPDDRTENIRRIGEVSKLFADAGIITLTSFISPYRADRDLVRRIHDEARLPFIEILVDVPVETCETRDPKGLYKKARAGEIKEFTGISAPYEPPLSPELVLKNTNISVAEAAAQVIDLLVERRLVTGL